MCQQASQCIMLSVGLSQGVAPFIGFCYGAGEKNRLRKAMGVAIVDGVVLGALFTVAFLLVSKNLTSIFLHDEGLIEQAAYFLRILSLSAPLLGIINMVTAYFQALGKAAHSLIITMMRNIILFIPGVILLNHFFALDGTIAAQPVVETVLSIICLTMYRKDLKTFSSDSNDDKVEVPGAN